jgi:23S rRNA pseudouridine2605 synthase
MLCGDASGSKLKTINSALYAIFALPVERTAKSTTMSKKPFEQFIKPQLKGAKKKEAIRQQKRKLKEESRLRGEAFRKKEAEKYQAVGTKYGNTPDKRNQPVAVNRQQAGKFTKDEVRNSKEQTDLPSTTNYQPATAEMPLNKFIAHAGICGRREAAELVKEGKVTVNGDIIYEPGYKVRGNEDVKVSGKKIFSQKNLVYLLLNKPKDYLTTLKDPEGRRTVLDLIKAATKERVYPVGRLDRNTTGVLLLTNDGELAQKLTHPSYEIKKIYEVKLDKVVAKADIEAILNGITLEDGFIKADAVSYADAKDKTVVGIEIHSGRNRIVRRIFEHLGYDVRNLDRVMFANLTKKNVDRGKWRYLNEKEIRLLKFMNQSFVRAKKERDEQEEKAIEEVLRSEKQGKAIKPKRKEEEGKGLGDKEGKGRKRIYKDGEGGKMPGAEAGKERKRIYKDTDGNERLRDKGGKERKRVYKDGEGGKMLREKGGKEIKRYQDKEGDKTKRDGRPGEEAGKERKRIYKDAEGGNRAPGKKTNRSFSEGRSPAKKSSGSSGDRKRFSNNSNRSSAPVKRSTGGKRS